MTKKPKAAKVVTSRTIRTIVLADSALFPFEIHGAVKRFVSTHAAKQYADRWLGKNDGDTLYVPRYARITISP